MSFTALVRKKTKHYTENLIAKLQNSEQNYRLFRVNSCRALNNPAQEFDF